MTAKKKFVTLEECDNAAHDIVDQLCHDKYIPKTGNFYIYGVPRGGLMPAAMVAKIITERFRKLDVMLTEDRFNANLFVDDLIDSGATKTAHDAFCARFVALFDKRKGRSKPWYVFPWESKTVEDDTGLEDNITRILQYIGEDVNRDGLKETPKRVVKSYDEIFGGYKLKPIDIMKTFEMNDCDEMVILKDIEFTSFCEHHMLPFMGKAHIAYIPDGRVIGISKLARLLDMFSRRLQIQERIGVQITTALDIGLKTKGSACVIEAKHSCMSCRGISKQHSVMITSSLTGVFLDKDNPGPRAEFMSLIR